MDTDENRLELFWDAVLSRQPKRIRAAIKPLDAEGRTGLVAHLQRMVSEEGWLPQQRQSAQAALEVLQAGDGAEPKP